MQAWLSRPLGAATLARTGILRHETRYGAVRRLQAAVRKKSRRDQAHCPVRRDGAAETPASALAFIRAGCGALWENSSLSGLVTGAGRAVDRGSGEIWAERGATETAGPVHGGAVERLGGRLVTGSLKTICRWDRVGRRSAAPFLSRCAGTAIAVGPRLYSGQPAAIAAAARILG